MSTPASRQESYYAGIRMVPYDLVKELSLALIGTLVLMVLLFIGALIVPFPGEDDSGRDQR